MENLIDPYRQLAGLGVQVLLGKFEDNPVELRLPGGLTPAQIREARWYAKTYGRLLALQIARKPVRPVRKLIAMGMVAVRNGRYVLVR